MLTKNELININKFAQDKLDYEFLQNWYDGLEIKLYYSEKLNNIVKRLPEIGADKEVLKQCFALLARLDNNLMTFKLDDKLITVEEPERLVEIKKAWKELESNL